jgi:diguanylate cyclase (GGDEF)-like protein
MECKFLDSYGAELAGDEVQVWYCRKRDPFVLGTSKEVAMATCSSCRLSDFTRPPAELAVEVERRNQELAALNAIVTAVNTSLELDTVLSMGLDKIVEILQVDAGSVHLETAGVYVLRASHGMSEEFVRKALDEPHGPGEGFVGLVVRRQETVVVGDSTKPPQPLPRARREGLVTLLGVPLKTQGRVLGVLTAATRQPRNYSADDIYFATAAGAQLAAALERAQLFREQQRLVDRERRLLEAAETVNRGLDSHALDLTILAEAAHLMGANKSALLAVHGDLLVAAEVYCLSEAYKRMYRLPLSRSVCGKAILNHETVAVDDVETNRDVDPMLAGEGGYRALLTAPLETHDGAYGAMTVFYDDVHYFTEDERMLLRTFAVQAAIALDNRRLMHEKDQLAVRDGLTGVFNRSYLEVTLERTTKNLRRHGGTVSIIFLDVDDMKRVNDSRGHQAGDRLLRELAALLNESCRDSDMVARYGGDEFVVLMPNTDEDGASAVSEKIAAAIAGRNRSSGAEPRLSASLGRHTASGADVESLLLEADRRMYAMKRTRARG